MNEDLIKLFKEYIRETPDKRKIDDKENRYNSWMFSYTGRSRKIYTAPRKIKWPSGKQDKRDIMSDREDALKKKNKPINLIEEFNYGYGYEFVFDHEVIILNDHEIWLSILSKKGLTYSTIPIFEEKYKKKTLKKGYFKNALDKRYHRLDLYDPIRHLNIEHDGEWCHISELDEARDEFLGIMYPELFIERVSDYKDTSENKNKLKEIFETYKTPLYKNPLVFRYDSWIIEQQLLEHESDLLYISECLELGYSLGTIQNELALELYRFQNA